MNRKSKSHTLWHHLAMVVISEVINFIELNFVRQLVGGDVDRVERVEVTWPACSI